MVQQLLTTPKTVGFIHPNVFQAPEEDDESIVFYSTDNSIISNPTLSNGTKGSEDTQDIR
jgi:hypothetical protein